MSDLRPCPAPGARATHHTGLLVADIDRATQFYVEALDGTPLTRPVVLEGWAAEMVMGAPEGTRYAMALIGLAAGAVELFSFVGPVLPEWARPGAGPRRLPHLGLQVDDVDATLRRVEAAGGARLFGKVTPWGAARVVYATDLDDNVIELLDAPLEVIVAEAVRMFPDAAL